VGRKQKHHEEEGNNERWLVSYADFITLLFAFFTTLYAISTVDAQKMGKMVTSMRQSFDNTVFSPGSKTLSLSQGRENSESASASRHILNSVKFPKGVYGKDFSTSPKYPNRQVLSGEKALGKLKRSVEGLMGSDVLKGTVRTHVDPRGLIISLGEGGFFDSGSDQIKPEGRSLLDTMATSLVSLGNQIRVEGHTDNVPIRNSKFPSNWELSTARATAIVSYLIAKFGFSPELLSAAGYSEFRPVAPNDSEDGRSRNRRVDIVILNPSAAQNEPK
jgi:chemotaxis protein MotB